MAVTYGQYIQVFLKVDEDSKGLYVEVPGYSSDTFKVRCEENDICPQVTHCRCSKFAHKGTCEHAQAVQFFWNRIYKSNIAKAEMKALEQAMDASDLIGEQYEEVAFVEQVLAATKKDQTPLIVTTPAPKVSTSSKIALSKVVKIDHHSIRTARFFSALPSRQRKEVVA